MKLSKNDAISLCAFLFDKVNSITELRHQIEEMKLKEQLGTEGILTVVDYYQQHALKKVSDKILIDELSFWANGGNYNSHLDGFNAFSPNALIEAAKSRNWIVKEFSSKILISPSEGAPITLNKDILNYL